MVGPCRGAAQRLRWLLTRLPCHPLLARRGLAGRKLEAGFNARHDLLLFGEAADAAGGVEGHAEEDVWLGLDTSSEPDAAAERGGSGGDGGGGGGQKA